jgi:hypothetical protein
VREQALDQRERRADQAEPADHHGGAVPDPGDRLDDIDGDSLDGCGHASS